MYVEFTSRSFLRRAFAPKEAQPNTVSQCIHIICENVRHVLSRHYFRAADSLIKYKEFMYFYRSVSETHGQTWRMSGLQFEQDLILHSLATLSLNVSLNTDNVLQGFCFARFLSQWR